MCGVGGRGVMEMDGLVGWLLLVIVSAIALAIFNGNPRVAAVKVQNFKKSLRAIPRISGHSSSCPLPDEALKIFGIYLPP